MMQIRKTLTLRHSGGGNAPEDEGESVFAHAITHQLCVRASYNRGLVILAPHILYTRHGDRFADAVVIERNGARSTETKLGTFKLSGLRGAVITSEPFNPFDGYGAGDDRYTETIIARIDS
ncbi:hypothetical protein sphantq_00608 [Sphingobium sp. AntQ-1]|uniref:hypothetical protein n=1 Tax=Sphingobium TaxID=165695 RepID=UPI000AF44D01|nr:hypothetical protein [Sphingobium sp. AntQ-1]WCP12211.1 hypothetical protein sphantq_00608 [Sphingobium sp. AntQ-1]